MLQLKRSFCNNGASLQHNIFHRVSLKYEVEDFAKRIEKNSGCFEL